MKKIFIITGMTLLMVFSAMGTDLRANYYLTVTGEMTNFKSVQFLADEIKFILENGDKFVIPKSQVKAVRANGKYYEKLPVIVNNKPTDKEEFMEFVATRGGLKLFKFKDDIGRERSKGFNLEGFKMDYYVVFRGDQFHVEVTDKNYPTLFKFFRIKYTEV